MIVKKYRHHSLTDLLGLLLDLRRLFSLDVLLAGEVLVHLPLRLVRLLANSALEHVAVATLCATFSPALLAGMAATIPLSVDVDVDVVVLVVAIIVGETALLALALAPTLAVLLDAVILLSLVIKLLEFRRSPEVAASLSLRTTVKRISTWSFDRRRNAAIKI